MLDIVVNIDQGCSKCLVYKNRESTLSGQLRIRTSDKLKLRQLAIRLISTELVDINDDVNSSSTSGSSSLAAAATTDSLRSYLQKTSKTAFVWAVLPKNGTTHVLEPGNHQYAIEMPLPKGLDGSIETKAYALRYELETRLEYSFRLKPDTTTLTPLVLDQVPMAWDLYSDDRISLKMPAHRYTPTGGHLAPENVPLGQALCLNWDIISQRKPFVFTHLWNNCLSLRLRFPRGRVFSVASQPMVLFEALPINKEFKVTKVTAFIEQITIIARPQKAETSSSSIGGGRQKSNSISFSPVSPSSANPYGASGAQQQLADTLLGGGSLCSDSSVAHAAASSQDSLEPNTPHNALAYAREFSSEYSNAITKVRDLGRDTQYSRFGPVELPKSHGMFAGKLHICIPETTPTKPGALSGIRNSHVQVHHQLVYVVQYHRVKQAATQDASSDIVEGNSTAASMAVQRIKAVASLYGKLDHANIVRRDELKNNDPALVPPLTHEYWIKPRSVRGTLPISLVSGKIGELWCVRDLTPQESEEAANAFVSEPDSAALEMPLPRLDESTCGSSTTAFPNNGAFRSGSVKMPMPVGGSEVRKGEGGSRQSAGSSNDETQFEDELQVPIYPGRPQSQSHSQPQSPAASSSSNGGFGSSAAAGETMYPPMTPSAMPVFPHVGFNPMLLPPMSQARYPPPSVYPPDTMQFGVMDPLAGSPFAPPPSIPQISVSVPPVGPPLLQPPQYPYGGMAEAPAPYNNAALQEQILQFQEQQRKQQQQFFEQLSKQYTQMAGPQQQQQQYPYCESGPSTVPQWSSPYPPAASSTPHAVSQISSVGNGQSLLDPQLTAGTSTSIAAAASQTSGHQPPHSLAAQSEQPNTATNGSADSLSAQMASLAVSRRTSALSEAPSTDAQSGQIENEHQQRQNCHDDHASENYTSAAEEADESPGIEAAETSGQQSQTVTATTAAHSSTTTQSLQLTETAPASAQNASSLSTELQVSSTPAAASSTIARISPVDDHHAAETTLNPQRLPPPSYEDLLPPEYEVPISQPPPYNAVERSGRGASTR
ncbi:hypothetical protein GGI11_002679 [Coemansia sp. RSA 2049]|nr:hypothetical protein GGI11_002679 [Coemansia sp. RSA 2049]KAJ2521663.1 hypothetical protein H4217_001244 [Coemansia sp. RSA 1939]KAJ2614562.1 hypothetical protein EV177_002004 [Coemansia sp. RSA 1804]KAJ2693787.1 hypothetical protein GGH99_000986 [Coemansia sp. RSA 1285]